MSIPSIVPSARPVIRPAYRPEGTVQPTLVETEPITLQNLFGAEFLSTRAIAEFEADAAIEAASQGRDLEVVIITPAGERRCDTNDDDILEIFGLQ